MAQSINPRTTGDADVYEAVDANLIAGVFVIPSATATESGLQGVAVAGNAAKNVVGVSAKSAVTAANRAAEENGTLTDGYPFTDASVPDATLTVYRRKVVPVTYTAAAVGFGAKIASAAAGQARAWVTGDGPDAIVGECRVVGGMSSAGGVGLAYLY
jgi:hypothetical protein